MTPSRFCSPGTRPGALTLSLALSILALGALNASAAAADKAGEKPAGTLIDFQAQADRTAPNDLGRATAYYEATASNPGELARKVNTVIAAALATARQTAAVKTRSGGSQSSPIYTRNSRQIESWRMRSELLLESRDTGALAELLGQLQATLAIGNISFAPAPETRRKAEDDATLSAIAAFQDKAARYAGALQKPYRIKSLRIGSASAVPPAPTYRAMAMAEAVTAPMPTEAGESLVVVTVSGQIELE